MYKSVNTSDLTTQYRDSLTLPQYIKLTILVSQICNQGHQFNTEFSLNTTLTAQANSIKNIPYPDWANFTHVTNAQKNNEIAQMPSRT